MKWGQPLSLTSVDSRQILIWLQIHSLSLQYSHYIYLDFGLHPVNPLAIPGLTGLVADQYVYQGQCSAMSSRILCVGIQDVVPIPGMNLLQSLATPGLTSFAGGNSERVLEDRAGTTGVPELSA